MLVRWTVPFLVGIIIFLIIGWFTGNGKKYGGKITKDDERSQFIKQKAIVHSWTFMLILLVMNSIFDFFNLTNSGLLKNTRFDHPTLFYLIILIGSYFAYYLIYRIRLSSNEK